MRPVAFAQVHDLDVRRHRNARRLIFHHDDRFLVSEASKGSMTLIEWPNGPWRVQVEWAPVSTLRGSAANTMTGVASFGGAPAS